jgi:thymidylate kinase
LTPYDVITSSEPTFSLIGRAIREEIVRHNKREYSALATAQAFALDRYILYKRVIIPALQQGKYIFQERGVTTSICYQPIQKEPLSLKKVLELEGNQLTLKYRPDLLIITVLKPETAMQRLANRDGKKDGAIFEKLDFLKKAQKRFINVWFRKIFEKRGAKVFYINTIGQKEENAKKIIEIWQNFIKL